MDLSDRVKLYEVYSITLDPTVDGSGKVTMPAAFTPDGVYIGDPTDANTLCVRYGIAPILHKESHSVCSIGFSEREQKWYGWSHRAIHGFSIGHVVEEDSCALDGGSIEVGFVCKTLEDCRRVAEAFAESVS